jgi:hypothetical protein
MLRFLSFSLIFLISLNVAAVSKINSTVTDFMRQHQTESVVLAVLFFSLLASEALQRIWKQIFLSLQERHNSKQFLSKAKSLSPSDKHILSLFVDERKMTRQLDPNEPSVAWLESIKFLYRSEGSGEGARAPYRISMYAMNHLSKNPNLLR